MTSLARSHYIHYTGPDNNSSLDGQPISSFIQCTVLGSGIVGYDQNQIISPETGMEPKFRFRLAGNINAFKNSGAVSIRCMEVLVHTVTKRGCEQNMKIIFPYLTAYSTKINTFLM